MTDQRRRPPPAADRGGPPAPVRPRSVREGMPGEGAPPEIETEERVVEVASGTWTVRAAGRARVRSGGAGTPLIQLVFTSDDGEELEALVVGRTLADLSDARLVSALDEARPHRSDEASSGFFEGTRQPGGRGRG